MWFLWIDSRTSFCVPPLLILWLLESRPYNRTSNWEWAHLLFVSHFSQSIWSQDLLGADVKTGRVFCSDCDDFVLDAATENVFFSTVLSAEEKESRFLGGLP